MAADAARAASRRPSFELRAPPRVGAIEQGRRDERHQRQPDELDAPAETAQRPAAIRTERDRNHGPGDRRPHEQKDRRREREAREEPANAREAHQPHREFVAGEGGRAAIAGGGHAILVAATGPMVMAPGPVSWICPV